jgi:cellulose synthase/poly-beta-1,6-N-acetylglucosamine synthase-like glycosyltransferase
MTGESTRRFRLKDLGLWRTGGIVACLLLLAAMFAFPRLVLPILALLCGGLFFVYGVKSYSSVAIIMLSTTGTSGSPVANGDGRTGRKPGLLHRLKGGRAQPEEGGGRGKPYRLPPEKQPFISIQLPMYNEDRVVDRLLAACTQLDYENYEVLVADDSSDDTLRTLERWARHPKVRVSHRINRSGFKGAALKHATEVMSPKAQFVAVFDADFVPPPDILHQFLSYFYGVSGNGNENGEGGAQGQKPGNGGELYLLDESLAVVQGYQWHVLNASENWITRGIRAEFAGSYVIERSSQELTGGMKMISGSVFMIRADVLRKHKWGTSITEDWELTLRLYLDGYKVLYTPFIQAPAECVSDFKQLVRQRMRWAEGHTFNVKRYFPDVLRSPNLTVREKLEFIYYAPYYLTSVLFILGTLAWMISELILRVQLPFWSELFGWSLVFTNAFALILMNLAGLFQERGVRRSWTGLLSFVLLTFLLVPYQAYAALKGLLEFREGSWHRTRKSGVVTDIVRRMGLGRRMPRLMPKQKVVDLGRRLPVARIERWIPGPVRNLAGKSSLAFRLASALIGGVVILALLTRGVNAVFAAPDTYYFHDSAPSGISPAGKQMDPDRGNGAAGIVFNQAGQVAYWYTDLVGPVSGETRVLGAGDYSLEMFFQELPLPAVPEPTPRRVEILVSVSHTAPDGSGAIPIVTSSTVTIDSATPSPYELDIGRGEELIFRATDPRRLRVQIEVASVSEEGSFTLEHDSPAGPSSLSTPALGGPNPTLLPLAGAIFIPPISSVLVKRPRMALRLISVGLSVVILLAVLSPVVAAAADPTGAEAPRETTPGWEVAVLIVVPLIPYLISYLWTRGRRAAQTVSILLAAILALAALAGSVEEVIAAPDTFYLHPTATSGITPAGEYMNNTAGSAGSTKGFDTAGQNAYWYADATWPTGNDNASIAAGAYTLNMYFASRPGAGSGDYPSVQTTATSATTTAGTSHTLTLPTGIQSGDLLIAMLSGFIGSGSTAVDISWPSGWTEFFEQDASTSTLHLAVAGAYRQADGTEGTSITVTTNVSVLAAHNAYRITGAADPSVRPPEAASVGYTDTATNIDPPSLSPTGGAKDYLWLAVAAWRRTGRVASTDPTNYTNAIEASSAGGASGTKLRSLRRQLNASSEDPSQFTLDLTSERRAAVTIAIHPAASVDIQVTVSHTAPDGSGATTIVQSSTTTINASTADPYALSIGSGALQTFTSADPRRLRVQVNVVSVNNGGNFTLDYDGACASGLCSNLDTPVVTVPEYGLILLPIALLIPAAVPLLRKRRPSRAQTHGPNLAELPLSASTLDGVQHPSIDARAGKESSDEQ